MKFKTYQSAIGIFIVSIVAIFLYIFLDDDLHKRIVVYSAFSVIIIWSALLINHRRKTAKKLRAMTKACILGENNNGEYCDGVKRRMTRYAEEKGKTYEMVAEEIRNQILKKKGAGWKKSMQMYGQPINHEKDEHLQTSSRVEETDDKSKLVKQMLDCLNDENAQGQICETVVNAVKMHADELGLPYEVLAKDLRNEALKKLNHREGGMGGNHNYGEFAPGSGYGHF